MRETQTRRSVRRTGMAALVAAILIAACGDGGGSGGAGDFDPSTYYEGKTVEIWVPNPPGGATDTQAHVFAAALERHLPGSPNVVVVNIEGGQGLRGPNEYQRLEEYDGTKLLMIAFVHSLAWMTGEQALELPLSDLVPIANVPTSILWTVRPESGVASALDLYDTSAEMVLGGRAPNSVQLPDVLAREILGLEDQIQVVWGYGAGNDLVLAYEQRELSLLNVTIGTYVNRPDLYEGGAGNMILSHGYVQPDRTLARADHFPDVPTTAEIYAERHGADPSGDLWEAYLTVMTNMNAGGGLATHRDTPPEVVDVLVQALVDADQDPEWQDLRVTRLGEDGIVNVGEDARALADSWANTDPAHLATVSTFIEERFADAF